MSRLREILLSEAKKLTEEFSIASIQGEGTPQEIADFREGALHDFFRRFRPESSVVTKGKITDFDGNQSNSIDCILLNKIHPHIVDSCGKFKLIFADGCDVAIELKPDLARQDELIRALEQSISVKRIRRSKPTSVDFAAIFDEDLNEKSPSNRLRIEDYSRSIPIFIFATKSFEIEKLIQKIQLYYKENAISVDLQIDGIFINGVGILRNIKHIEDNLYAASDLKGMTGWFFEHWSDLTLAGVLFTIESVHHAEIAMTEPIMQRLTKEFHYEIKTQYFGNADGLLLQKS